MEEPHDKTPYGSPSKYRTVAMWLFQGLMEAPQLYGSVNMRPFDKSLSAPQAEVPPYSSAMGQC